MTNLEQSIINRLNTIDDIAEETELAVLESMADAYGKALVLMEHCHDSEVLAKYPLFQESVFFQEADEAEQTGNDQANKPKTAADIKLWNDKDSAVKNIALFVIRLIGKIALIIKEAIVPSVANIEKNADAAINAAGNAGETAEVAEQLVNSTTGEGDTPKKKARSAGAKVLAGILVAGGISAGIAAKIYHDKYKEKNERLETILADKSMSKEEKIEEVSEIVAQMAEAKNNFTYIIITANAQKPVASLLNLQGIVNVNNAIISGFSAYTKNDSKSYNASGDGKKNADALLNMMKTGDKEGIASFINSNFYSTDKVKHYTADQFHQFLNQLNESDTALINALKAIEARAKSEKDTKKINEIRNINLALMDYIKELKTILSSINTDVTMFNTIYSKYGEGAYDEDTFGSKLPDGKKASDILKSISANTAAMNDLVKEIAPRFNTGTTKYVSGEYDEKTNKITLKTKDGKISEEIFVDKEPQIDNIIYQAAKAQNLVKESVTEDVEDETITEAMRQKGVEIAAKEPNKILADAQTKFREAISKNDPEIARQTWKLLRDAELGAANAEFGEKWYERIDEYRDRLKATFGTDTFASSSTTTEYATEEDFFDGSSSDDMFEEGALTDYLKQKHNDHKAEKAAKMTPEELAKKEANAKKREELKNKAIEGAESVGKKLSKLPAASSVANAARTSNEKFSSYNVKPFSARIEEDPKNPEGLLFKVDIKLPTTSFPNREVFYYGLNRERDQIEEALKRIAGKHDSKVVFSYEPAEIQRLIDEG